MSAQKRLKAQRPMTPELALRDLNPTRAPVGTPQSRWSESQPRGRRENKSLAWYRGEQAGIHHAYLTIRRAYPQAAAALLAAFQMDKQGNIHV